ncbi:hypothetical protein JCM11251_000731 [Rhodosporidiobolus azoricus]
MLLLGAPLYRALLKKARVLPDPLVAEHYRNHIRSSFRREPVPEASEQAIRRVKAAQKLLRQLQAANDGYLHALTRAFETAYGLRGKGKHVALAPFLNPGLLSRTFPPALSALLTSPLSHLSRPPTPSQLSWPPTLSLRADPASEEARQLGHMTIQRERAVRRRWWNLQTGKVRPPIAVRVRRGDETIREAKEVTSLLKASGVVMSEEAVREGWERLAALEGSSFASSPLPPRRSPSRSTIDNAPAASSATPSSSPLPPFSSSQYSLPSRPCPPRVFKPLSSDTKWHPPKHLTPRLLRRLSQGVAEKAVVLTLVLPVAGDCQKDVEKWEVSLSKAARGARDRYREVEMGGEEEWWFEQGEAVSGEKKGKKGGKKR